MTPEQFLLFVAAFAVAYAVTDAILEFFNRRGRK